MKKLLFASLFVIGCASSEPHNPLKRQTELAWWQESTVGVKPEDNPWEAFVHQPVKQNEFDPWANDDLQRYSVSPVITRSVVKPDPDVIMFRDEEESK